MTNVERSAKWRRENPEREKTNRALWDKANPERAKANRASWQKANPEKRRAAAARWRKAHPKDAIARHIHRRYAITPAQYDAMLVRQGGVCALRGCGNAPKTRRLHVDHDHATGCVRGLLCFTCNLFKVSRNTLESAQAVVEYLSNDFDGRSL